MSIKGFFDIFLGLRSNFLFGFGFRFCLAEAKLSCDLKFKPNFYAIKEYESKISNLFDC